MNYYIYGTNIGNICICEQNGSISHIVFSDSPPVCKRLGQHPPSTPVEYQETPIIERAALELAQYLSGYRTDFDIPLNPDGTDFQKKVWAAMAQIPYGTTLNFGAFARALGTPLCHRAIGLAQIKNPISIMIPSHRLIGKTVQDEEAWTIRKSLQALECQRAYQQQTRRPPGIRHLQPHL